MQEVFQELLEEADGNDFEDALINKNDNYKHIKRSLWELMPNASIHFFGSRMMGVSSTSSDLDIFVEMDDCFYDSLPEDSIEHYMSRLSYLLSYDGDWDFKVQIYNTPVPFIRAVYQPYNLMCDIVFSNGLGVKTTVLLSHLFDIQPEEAKFCIFLKNWFRSNGIKMKKYLIVLLGVFYLQCLNYLPSIQTVLQRSRKCGNFKLIYGYEAHYDEHQNLSNYRIRRLVNFMDEGFLENFFVYYRDFDYNDFVISTFEGKELYREDLDDPLINKPIVVFGPILMDKNVAGRLGAPALQRFKSFCQASYEII